MGDSLVLYHYWRSSASWRVRWGLEIKGIRHEKVAVDLLAGEEKLGSYTSRNPSGYLPCLVVNSKETIAESVAILEWLEEQYPNRSFFCGDSFQRACIRRLVETVNSGTQPLQNLDVIRRVSPDKALQAAWAKGWIERGLKVYERILEEIGSPAFRFSMADHPTLADLCLIPQCYSALRFGVDLDSFPRTKAIYENALTTPECLASHPDRFQPK